MLNFRSDCNHVDMDQKNEEAKKNCKSYSSLILPMFNLKICTLIFISSYILVLKGKKKLANIISCIISVMHRVFIHASVCLKINVGMQFVCV